MAALMACDSVRHVTAAHPSQWERERYWQSTSPFRLFSTRTSRVVPNTRATNPGSSVTRVRACAQCELRVHDVRHTFAQHLRQSGVTAEDRSVSQLLE